MRAAALVLARHVCSAFMAPPARSAARRAGQRRRVQPRDCLGELYEVGGVQVTADVQQFGPIAGLAAFIAAANTLYMTMGGSMMNCGRAHRRVPVRERRARGGQGACHSEDERGMEGRM